MRSDTANTDDDHGLMSVLGADGDAWRDSN